MMRYCERGIGAFALVLGLVIGAGTAIAATPNVFTTLTQPVGVAATSTEVLVAQPYCVHDTQTGPLSPNQWQIVKIDTSGNQTVFTVLPSDPNYGLAGTSGILSNCQETDLAIATGLTGGFTGNDVFATEGGHIYEFNPSGALVRTLAVIPSLEVAFAHTSLVFDNTGLFGNKLIVVGTDASNFGEIWTVDSSGTATKIFTLTSPQSSAICKGGDEPCFETPDVAPLTGPIGSAFPGWLFLPVTPLSGISADIGALSPQLSFSFPGGVAVPETVHIVPSASPPCTFTLTTTGATYEFFNANFSAPQNSGTLSNTVYAYRASDFTGLAGQLLVTTEGGIPGVVVSTDSKIDFTSFDSTGYNGEGSAFVQCTTNCNCVCPQTSSGKHDKGIGEPSAFHR